MVKSNTTSMSQPSSTTLSRSELQQLRNLTKDIQLHDKNKITSNTLGSSINSKLSIREEPLITTYTVSHLSSQNFHPSATGEYSLEKKKHLKELSNQRIQNWPNTLDATRKKKENFLRDKQEALELQRQEIDRQEMENRRLERIKVIENANKLIFQQKDKMKLYNSQLLLCDINNFRAIQIEEKKALSRQYREEDKYYYEYTMQECEKFDQIEEKKREMEGAKRSEVALTRKKQLEEIEAIRQKERLENEKLGIALRIQAKEIEEEEEKLVKVKQEFVKSKNIEFMKTNEEIIKFRKEMKDNERIAIEKCNQEQDEIERRNKKIKELESNRFEKSQLIRKRLIDKATDHLSTLQSNEETLLQKQIQEQRNKEDAIFENNRKNRENQLQLMIESRNEQMKLRYDEEKKELEEEQRIIEKWNEAHEREEKHDEELRKERFEFVKQLKESQYQDALQHKYNKINNKIIENEKEKLLYQLACEDDEKFDILVKDKYEEYQKLGKNVYPLLKIKEMKSNELVPAKLKHVNKPTKPIVAKTSKAKK